MTKHVAILCIAAIAAPAAADDNAPRSLRMRDPQTATRTSWNPIRPGRRVAQVPPDPAPAPPAAPSPGSPGQPDDDSGTPSPSTNSAPASPPAAPPPTEPTPAAVDATAPDTPPDALPEPPPDVEGRSEVISVEGSSVEHELFTGRAPISVVTRDALTASGRATLGEILQSLPIQANAGNAQVNAGGDGTTRINLRGLGVPRTLVLLNGRRVVNGGPGADAAVDLNAIPVPMIERVEILKDGASAMYGADAVGGVVNIITRPKFDGADVSLLTSTSQRGDGTEYDASLVTGFTTRDKRTYLVLSAGLQQTRAVFAGDRAFSNFQRSYDFANKAEIRNDSTAVPGGRLDAASIRGGMPVPGCTSGVCKPDGDGGWADFATPGDLYNDAAENYLYTPSSRYNLFGTASKRVNDHAAIILEMLYLQRTSERELSPVAFVADAPISKDSLYNPFGGDILDYRRRVTELGPRHYLDGVRTFRLVLGLHGDVPESSRVLKNWRYEASFNYGATSTHGETTGQLIKPRLADALGPSMRDADGVPICVRTPGDPTTRIVYAIPFEDGSMRTIPCVPLNLLAPAGAIPRDQLANVTYDDALAGTNTMRTFLATASGQVAELPNGGKITLALGGDHRQEVGERLPARVASVGYTTDDAVSDTRGDFRILEGFGELAIVPITGHDVAKWVELDLGVRALSHSRFGASLTYKLGGLFRTAHGIAMRGTYATAYRAPSVPDLFGGRTQRNPAAEDPCDTRPPSAGAGPRTLDPMVQAQCTAQGVPVGTTFATSHQISVIGGNPELEPERAATATLGVVVEPPQVEGLALSADYWHIAIDNAIEALGVHTIFANCYERGLQAFCDQIHRDQMTHRISPVDQVLQNVPRTTMSGVDVALRYDTRLAGRGRLHSGLEAQYLLGYDLDAERQVIRGVGYYDLGVYPRFKANLSSHWTHPRGASAGFLLRYIGGYQECAGNNCNSERSLAMASRDVGRYVKLDLFGSYALRPWQGTTTLQLGVNNVLDAAPPVVYNATAANSDAATYDFVGRTLYLRLSQRF